MITSYDLVTGPAFEPLDVEAVKDHARITGEDSNGVVATYIKAAREEAEDALGFGLITQTWRYDLSSFAEVIPLPKARVLQSITSVKYYDADGVLQTLSSTYYTTDTIRRPACLVRASAQSWPSLQADRNTGRVQITYVVGWTTAAAVPERIKQGMRLWLTFLDLNRDGTEDATNARAAAYACWSDRLFHLEPSCA